MALSTIAFCRNCKWRSSDHPIQRGVAGAPCPKCGHGVSALHCDPDYSGTDGFGRPYVEADAMKAHLEEAGISPTSPNNIALPRHSDDGKG